MTSAELRTAVRDLTGRPASYARLTDAQIDAYVAEGATRFAQETLPPGLLDSVSINTSNGVSTYEVSGNPLRVVSAFISGEPLVLITSQRLFVSHPAWPGAASATPTHFFLVGRDATSGNPKLRLWPTPNATMAMTVTVLKKPSALPGSGEILEWDLLEQNAFADFDAHKHLSLKTEVDQDNARDVFKARFDSTVDLYRRINDVDSYHSQKAGTESGWRTTQ